MTTLTPEQEARELIERAKKLPIELQEMIAGELRLDRTGDPELKAELTRRWARLRSGEEKTKNIDEVIAALRQQNEARRA